VKCLVLIPRFFPSSITATQCSRRWDLLRADIHVSKRPCARKMLFY
jgi:hypothetical protein